MNEQQFAERIRLALDDSAEHLPYKVAYRLQLARQAALARMPERVAVEGLQQSTAALSASSGAMSLTGGNGRGQRWGRTATSALAVLVLVGGLAAISVWSDLDEADETADVDLAVLTDEDVPISAYADRGFGVFLKNTQQ